MKALIRLALPIVVFSSLFNSTAHAQNDWLEIMYVNLDAFPTVKVLARAYCNGVRQADFDESELKIYENGRELTKTVSCPQGDEPFSVGICVDRSNSVSPYSHHIKRAANRFVELMENRALGNDEGAVVNFSEDVFLDQIMTTDKQALKDAFDILRNPLNTAIWDALMVTIEHVAANANNPTKAVIVITDGGDNHSTHTLQEVINLSVQNTVPVYPVVFRTSVVDPGDIAELDLLAQTTGGKMIIIDYPTQIDEAFKSLMAIIPGGLNDCEIEFETDCADGSVRRLIVEAVACGQTLRDTTWYLSPIDYQLPRITVWTDSSFAFSGGELRVPVLISNNGVPSEINGLTFKMFKPSGVQLKEVVTDGYFAENFGVTYANDPDTLTVSFAGSTNLIGSDTLLVLKFNAPKIFGSDTTFQIPFTFGQKQTRQCFLLEIRSGYSELIQKTNSKILCDIDTIPVAWNYEEGRYEPEEFIISGRVFNPSRLTAFNTKAELIIPPDLELTSGGMVVDVANGTLVGGSEDSVFFPVRIKLADNARKFGACIRFTADRGEVEECCVLIDAEKPLPKLESWCDMPASVEWVDSLGRYEPESFPVTFYVRNMSSYRAKDVRATIAVPDGFQVDPGTPLDALVQPSLLNRADTGSISWMVTPMERAEDGTFEFCIQVVADGDTSTCCKEVFVPRSPIRAQLACGDPKVVGYDEGTGEYSPKVFLYRFEATNLSQIPIENGTAKILLPPFLKLAPGVDQVRDLPVGGTVPPGETVNLLWTLEASGPPVDGEEICVEVSAPNYPGETCCVSVRIERDLAIPQLICDLDGPDTIRYTDAGYVPSPFVLNVHVENIGQTKAIGVRAALIQGADLSIDSTDMSIKLLADSILAGEFADGTFRIKVLPRTVDRFDSIRVNVYSENGGSVLCEKVIYIERVRGPIIELTCEGPDSLRFNDATNSYEPSPFTISMIARNIGTAQADSVIAELLVSPNIELVTGEQAAKMLNPSRLDVGESGIASWQVNAVPRSVGRFDTIRVQVRTRSNLLAEIIPCPVIVYIPPVRSAEIVPECEALSQVTVDDDGYDPDTVQFRLTLRNLGDATAYDVRAVASNSLRLQLPANESLERTTPTIDPNGNAVFTWRFIPIPSTVSDSATVCFQISTRFLGDVFCCVKLYLPPVSDVEGDIAVGCATVDTVFADEETGEYPNPIFVQTDILNPTATAVDTVTATIILPSNIELAAGESADKRLFDLQPQESRQLQWAVNVIRDTSTVAKLKTISIRYYANGRVKTCEMQLVVMPIIEDGEYNISVFCSSPDSILYVNSEVGLQPSPFPVRASITNTGSEPLTDVSATISLPPQITLAAGEMVTKLLPGTFAPGATVVAEWSCIPSLRTTTYEVTFDVSVQAIETPPRGCETRTIVQGFQRRLVFSIPKGNIVGFGQSTIVPMNLSNTSQGEISEFTTEVSFDPSIVALREIEQGGTLTTRWPDLTLDELESGKISVSGSSNETITESGVLYYMRFTGVFGAVAPNEFDIQTSDLTIGDVTVAGDFVIEKLHGDITTAGSCLVPLDASDQFVLSQNAPNPFNPATVISYYIPQQVKEVSVRLEVFDVYGRLIEEFDQGMQQGGQYSIRFDASGLESGMYIYRLTAGSEIRTKKMILSR
ncbi:MAG: hypothetical protein CL946_10045 [Ectothiorhodospiraceae bacterium]|nr:hypothetical protein [Ectothiorhodospiraceae bacterium]